ARCRQACTSAACSGPVARALIASSRACRFGPGAGPESASWMISARVILSVTVWPSWRAYSAHAAFDEPFPVRGGGSGEGPGGRLTTSIHVSVTRQNLRNAEKKRTDRKSGV